MQQRARNPEPAAARPRAQGFIRRWYRYWLRMSTMGIVAGILIGAMANQASPSTFHYAYPTTGHTTARGR